LIRIRKLAIVGELEVNALEEKDVAIAIVVVK